MVDFFVALLVEQAARREDTSAMVDDVEYVKPKVVDHGERWALDGLMDDWKFGLIRFSYQPSTSRALSRRTLAQSRSESPRP